MPQVAVFVARCVRCPLHVDVAVESHAFEAFDKAKLLIRQHVNEQHQEFPETLTFTLGLPPQSE